MGNVFDPVLIEKLRGSAPTYTIGVDQNGIVHFNNGVFKTDDPLLIDALNAHPKNQENKKMTMKLNIESEGFVLKHAQEEGNPNIAYTKPHPTNRRGYKDLFVDVIYNENSEWVLIAQGTSETPYSDWQTIFAGNIRNQEDFKKVLTMVIV